MSPDSTDREEPCKPPSTSTLPADFITPSTEIVGAVIPTSPETVRPEVTVRVEETVTGEVKEEVLWAEEGSDERKVVSFRATQYTVVATLLPVSP